MRCRPTARDAMAKVIGARRVGACYNRTRHFVLHQRSTESSVENAVRRGNDDEPALHAALYPADGGG
jgi:hypothetical protein